MPSMSKDSLNLRVVAGDRLDEKIKTTIGSLRTDFLSLLHGESVAFSAFLAACTKFDGLVSSCHGSLQEDTIEALYDFSGPLMALSPVMEDLASKKSTASSQFSSSIMDILSEDTARLSISDEQPAPPAYIEPCARWLKGNWHNPYPSPQTRSEIARQTHTARKDIDAWFIDMRKRIGWNDLRRTHFDNKRANIVEAATRFLQGDSGEGVVDDEEESYASSTLPAFSSPFAQPANAARRTRMLPRIENEFAGIMHQAMTYYDERFAKSGLATKLDGAVRDMTPSLKEQLQKEHERLRREKAQKNSKRSARHAYPTPERSPVSSEEVLTPSPSSSVCDLTLVEESPTRKRRASVGEEESRPVKRARIGNNTTPPSPAPSLREATPSTPEEAPSTSTAPSTSNKRKRRLSDGFQYPAAKRPQLRQQAVSDPFPATATAPTPTPTFNIDEWDQWLWFAQFATSEPPMPGSVSVEAPDCTTPLDIELSSLPSYAMCSGSPESSPEHLPLSISSDYIPSVILESFCEVESEPISQASSSTSAAEYPLELPAYTYQEYLDATSLALHQQPYPSMLHVLQPLEVLPTATAASTVNIPSHSPSPITATATDLTSIPIPTFDMAHASFDLDVFLENLSGELAPLDHGSALELDMERFLAAGPLPHAVAGASNVNATTTTTAASGSLMSQQEREAKRRELEELEARARAIRAEICDA